MLALVPFLVGYIFGSVPFGLIFARGAGVENLRSIGSGNIGATNVLRTGKKSLAFLTLLADFSKGIMAILVFHFLVSGLFELPVDPLERHIMGDSLNLILRWVCGLGALLGHMFPVWLGFRGGGKGVATFFGLVAALCPWSVFFLSALTWIAVAFIWRYSSLASVVTVSLTPLWGFLFGSQDSYSPMFLLLYGLLILACHRSNVVRLYEGTETKIGQKNPLDNTTLDA
jgi:glycerol-3-phosphate acyltransferase PlsY